MAQTTPVSLFGASATNCIGVVHHQLSPGRKRATTGTHLPVLLRVLIAQPQARPGRMANAILAEAVCSGRAQLSTREARRSL